MKEDLKSQIREYYKHSEITSGTYDLGKEKVKKAYVDEILNNKIGNEILKIIRGKLKDVQGLKLLDMGCGLGGVVVVCGENNINAVGIDVDENAISIAQKRVKEPGSILRADGENLPFKNNHFDIVTSTLTIEHVKNPKKYISEAFRVLKKDGLFIIYAPNYLFPWEGHYKTLWLPYALPYTKFIFRAYLKIKKQNTEFLDFINFKITPGCLRKLLNRAGFKNIQDISTQRFLDRIDNPEEIANPGLGEIILKIKRNRILNNFLKIFINSLRITRLYHPIIFIAEAKK